jgi:hypothetical protein
MSKKEEATSEGVTDDFEENVRKLSGRDIMEIYADEPFF